MNYLLAMKIVHYINQWSNYKSDVFFVWSGFGSNKTKNILSFQPEIKEKWFDKKYELEVLAFDQVLVLNGFGKKKLGTKKKAEKGNKN